MFYNEHMTQEQQDLFATAVTGTFMWNFKKGDDIVYNYDVIWALYEARSAVVSQHAKVKLNKPIVVLLTAITECILDDFTNRTRQFVHERIQNITERQVLDFKTKKRDKLEHYIQAAKKHNILGATNNDIYDNLDHMRKMRNRVHIQNTKNVLDNDEYAVFTDTNRQLAEQSFEVVIGAMMTRFYRWGSLRITPQDVPYPWR